MTRANPSSLPPGERLLALGLTASVKLVVVVATGGMRVLSADAQSIVSQLTAKKLLGTQSNKAADIFKGKHEESPTVDHASVSDSWVLLGLSSTLIVAHVSSQGLIAVALREELPCSISALACAECDGRLMVAVALFGQAEVRLLDMDIVGEGKVELFASTVTGSLLRPSSHSSVTPPEGLLEVKSLYLSRRGEEGSQSLHLVAGLGDGHACIAPVVSTPSGLGLGPVHTSKVGQRPPRLVPLGTGELYLNSDRDALVRPPCAPPAPSAFLPIHTPRPRRTVVGLSTDPNQPASLAWLTDSGNLAFGTLSLSFTGRAESRPLSQTPTLLHSCPELQCLALTTEVQDRLNGQAQSLLRIFSSVSLEELAPALPIRPGHLVSSLSPAPPLPTPSTDKPTGPSAVLALASYSFDGGFSRASPIAANPTSSALLFVELRPSPPRHPHAIQVSAVGAVPLPEGACFSMAYAQTSATLLASADDHIQTLRWKACTRPSGHHKGPASDGADGPWAHIKVTGDVRTPHRGCVTAMALLRRGGGEGQDLLVVSEFLAGLLVYQVEEGTGLLQLLAQDLTVCPTASLLTGIRWAGRPAVLVSEAFERELMVFVWGAEREGPGGRVVRAARWKAQETVAAVLALGGGRGGFVVMGTGGSVHHYHETESSVEEGEADLADVSLLELDPARTDGAMVVVDKGLGLEDREVWVGQSLVE